MCGEINEQWVGLKFRQCSSCLHYFKFVVVTVVGISSLSVIYVNYLCVYMHHLFNSNKQHPFKSFSLSAVSLH